MNSAPVPVRCPCGGEFSVAESLKGGIANCPHCRRAIQIPGGFDPLFWGLLGGGSLLGLLVAVVAGAAGGWAWGIGVLSAVAVLIGVLVLVS